MGSKPGPSTRSVHLHPAEPGGPATPSAPAVHHAGVHRFPNLEDTVKALEKPGSVPLYLRYGHATGEHVEARMSALENTEAAVLFSSGLAALGSCLMTFCRSGDRIVASTSMYGGTSALLRRLQSTHGLDVEFVPIEALYASGTFAGARLVVVESPANPLTALVDFERFMQALPPDKPLTLLDGTFAPPVAQRGAEFGFDLVAHSATKYLGGHDDLLAGVVSGRRELVDSLREWRRGFGATCDPQSAWLLDRGLKTLGLRWERQCANALAVARFLEEQPGVLRVLHPGLPSHPDHDLARRQLPSFGAVVAFDLDGLEAARQFYDRVRWIQRAPTLGGVESTVLHPATASHRDLSPKERLTLGISDGTLRLSLGIEDETDLLGDIRAALGRT